MKKIKNEGGRKSQSSQECDTIEQRGHEFEDPDLEIRMQGPVKNWKAPKDQC